MMNTAVVIIQYSIFMGLLYSSSQFLLLVVDYKYRNRPTGPLLLNVLSHAPTCVVILLCSLAAAVLSVSPASVLVCGTSALRVRVLIPCFGFFARKSVMGNGVMAIWLITFLLTALLLISGVVSLFFTVA
jgi:hypothetical protein